MLSKLRIGDYTPETLRDQMVAGKMGDAAAILSLAVAMRLKADDCEREFIIVLRAFDLSELWKEVCVGSFEKYLDQNKICRPSRYAQGVLVLERVPTPELVSIGMLAGKQLVACEEDGARTDAMNEMLQVATAQGYPLSSETARDIVNRHIHRPPHRSSQQVEKIHALERENATLRRAVDVLTQENETLREQLRGAVPATQEKQAVTRRAKGAKTDRSQPTA